MANKRALFYCSANFNIDPKYNVAAENIVAAASDKGYEIVSGGGDKGTMAVVCRTAFEHGARVRGILPKFMEGLEYPGMDELIWTDTMSERKQIMREDVEVAVALPGGIGTLDEISETLCLAKMGIYKGKTIFFNLDGFYDDYIALLKKFVREKMYPQEALDAIFFPSTVEELVELL